MATKIKLMRLGKMREPHYRIVVADARTKRDGRAIETIGEYHPKSDPSIIKVDGERAAYWLGVGAQPTAAVAAILRATGDWQKYKGLPEPSPLKAAGRQAGQARPVQCRTGRDHGRSVRHSGNDAPKAPSQDRRVGVAPAQRKRPTRTEHSRPGRTHRRPTRTTRVTGRRADVLEEALEHLVRGIVDHPDDVTVDMVNNRRGARLEVRVHPDDLGRVIGRNGRTAKALRQVVAGVGGKGVRVDVIDVDRP